MDVVEQRSESKKVMLLKREQSNVASKLESI
jgi:hypothetical protein